MLQESIEWLCTDAGGIFLDCTFGRCGHTMAILDPNEKNFGYAIDRERTTHEKKLLTSHTHIKWDFPKKL